MKKTAFAWGVLAMTMGALAIGGDSRASLEEPEILSAFYGLDGQPLDAMPVTFSHHIDQSSLSRFDFLVQTQQGQWRRPAVVTLAPAGEENEDRTVLLAGNFGSATSDPPVQLLIVGTLLTEADENGVVHDLQGKSANVIPLEAGPELVWGEGLAQPEAGANNCPANTMQVVQVVFSGGVTSGAPQSQQGDEIGEWERTRFMVSYQRPDGTSYAAAPAGFGDLNDGDNILDLCLNTGDEPYYVVVAANTLRDPNGDDNEETGILLQ